MIIKGFLFILLSCSLLALCSERYRKQPECNPLCTISQTVSKVGAVLAMLLAAACLISQYGISVGVAAWFGMFTFAATTQMLIITYRPSWTIVISMLSVMGIIAELTVFYM